MGTLWVARAGCAAPGAGCRRPRMCGIGTAEAVLHIRPGAASDGSAESCGNAPAFNAGEILPCAERPALHMGARLLRTDILVGVPESCGKLEVDPRGRPSPMCSTTARAGKSSSGEIPLPSDEASIPAIGPGRPRPVRQRPFAGPRREPGPARPRPDTAGDRPRRTGPGGARPSPAPPGPRSPPPHRPRWGSAFSGSTWAETAPAAPTPTTAAAPGEKGSAPSGDSGKVILGVFGSVSRVR